MQFPPHDWLRTGQVTSSGSISWRCPEKLRPDVASVQEISRPRADNRVGIGWHLNPAGSHKASALKISCSASGNLFSRSVFVGRYKPTLLRLIEPPAALVLVRYDFPLSPIIAKHIYSQERLFLASNLSLLTFVAVPNLRTTSIPAAMVGSDVVRM